MALNLLNVRLLLPRTRPDSGWRALNSKPLPSPSNGKGDQILGQDVFQTTLCLERKRAERSRKQFLLLLLDVGALLQSDQRKNCLPFLSSALHATTRETDTRGWYEENAVLGIIFTELGETDKAVLLNVVRNKIMTALGTVLKGDQPRQVQLSFHFFPEDRGDPDVGCTMDSKLYPDLLQQKNSKQISSVVKRVMDTLGSLLVLIVSAPLLLFIAIAIKLTSKGPIFFKQERVGRYGVPFTLVKFRSMVVVNDPSIHKEYVKRFVSGADVREDASANQNAVYKIVGDPRVTRVGRFLRRTSLDEFPQFWNVLLGDMSLVGPRPPIAYELEAYDIWHKRRILEAKPGITGLWQVYGRSRTTFAEMVRLDLRYARTWSLWLDVKILLQTPRAVLFGEGAY